MSEPATRASSAAGDRARDVDAFIDAERERLFALVADLVACDSQIPPFSDERAVAGLVRDRMEALGLGRGEVVAADPDRPNVVVRIAGSGGGPTLMLNGHLDTKPVGGARSEWDSDPLTPDVRDGRLYGLGAADMKAAVAAMVMAAAALGATGPLAGDLVLAFVADEEAGATLGAKFLAPRLERIDAALVGEPSGWDHDWQGLHLVSRGLCCFRVRVRGTQMHSSLSDRMPSVNASRTMAELMVAIERELELDREPHPLGGVGPTLNVGVLVEGGVFFGVVPGHAEFACDLRTLPGMSEEDVHAALEHWLERRRAADPKLDAEIAYEPGLSWIPASEIARDHPLVHAAQDAAAHVLGAAPPLSVFPGACDAPWFAGAGIPTIPSFGPGVLTCCHGPNEHVELDRVQEAARIYAHTAAAFCGPFSTNARSKDT
jgi:acetylornithine deacetylase/succinyl-diaminopimelate desuccinylase-like protein